VKNFSLG